MLIKNTCLIYFLKISKNNFLNIYFNFLSDYEKYIHNFITEMADKIAEHLPNYASNDITILSNAISGLSILDHTTNTKSMMDKIEESVAKL